MDIARVIVIGNLTRDPELRHTQGGTAVCSLSIACNMREKVNGEWTDRASYFDVTVFGGQGENAARYLSKGSKCGIDGQLRQDRWEKDGQKRYAVKIIAENVQFLTKKEDGGGSNTGQSTTGGDFAVPTATDNEFAVPTADFSSGADDDIPF